MCEITKDQKWIVVAAAAAATIFLDAISNGA